MRAPNIADARELSLLPSVTTILKVLDRPNLNDWKATQACMAVLTTPRQPKEELDAFVKRVLQVEMVQNEESKAAADKGTAIHEALQLHLEGKQYPAEWVQYVSAVIPRLSPLGRLAWTEKVIVGDGYAGRSDAGFESDQYITLVDFKTTGTLPKKEAYKEHQLQVASYAKGLGNVADKHIVTCLLYISTKEPGKTEIFFQENWLDTYERGFMPVLNVWRYLNGVVA